MESTSRSALAADPAAAKLLQTRDRLDRTLWRDEVLSQRYEEYFIDLWDRIRAADDRLAVLRATPPVELSLPESASPELLSWGVERIALHGAEQRLSREEFVARLDAAAAAGYRLDEAEFHHSAFDPPTAERGATSVVSFVLHVSNAESAERVVVHGDLHVAWNDAAEGRPAPSTVDVRGATVLRRTGEPAFRETARFEFKTDPAMRDAPGTPHPFLARDLNRDGRTDFVSASFNRIYWNEGTVEGKTTWREEPLLSDLQDVSLACAGLFADFNGDGHDDLFLGMANAAARVYLADAEGRFSSAAILVESPALLTLPTGVTAGDVDRDGDLDLWVGQYKAPYASGAMPTPYYDANDGFPGYLLLGDGEGRFVDATPGSGLEQKRRRRNFSSSLIDLDGDGNLDLITVNDFAGFDLFHGDGTGRFRDVTGEAAPDLDAFGMAHTFGDYNRDGLLDVYVIGMSSTTARRLERLGLGRLDFAEHTSARRGMGYGNRMLLGDGDGGFRAAPFADQVARTGWSWGCTSFDADNDGRLEVYVCNGHTSGESCRDYCTRFWTHDIYTGGSQASAELDQLFSSELFDVRSHQISWNGFEHNVLWHQHDDDFVNVAYLMGVGFEADCRSALSEDVDGDGRVDLVVEETDWRTGVHRFRVMRNAWPTDHHWIGLQVFELGDGLSPQGARVVCQTADRRFVSYLASGHSTLCQHSGRVHFGLGETDAVEALEVHWPGGRVSRIDAPAIDAYHDVGDATAAN